MLVEPIAFPRILPEGFALNENEPQFDPKRHLALEPPKQIWRLQDFGYSREAIASVPTDIAVAGPFRILSPEGATCLREVARNLIPCHLEERRQDPVAAPWWGIPLQICPRLQSIARGHRLFVEHLQGAVGTPHNADASRTYELRPGQPRG